MSRNLLAVVVVVGTIAVAADLPEKWAKRIETADSTYKQAIQTADNTRFYAAQKANATRVKAFRQVLTEATKAGDFDAATAIKERITAAESAGIPRDKPKGVIKFGGHEYALLNDLLPWHVAKQRCEEMGGHLVCMETQPEVDFILKVAGDTTVWIGATDERLEGDWRWVTGPKVTMPLSLDNAGDADHWMAIYHGVFHDGTGGNRWAYICEWDE